DHRDTAILDASLEGHDIVINPQVHSERLAREYGGGKARLMAENAYRIVAGEGLEDGPTRNPKAAQSGKNGSRKASAAGYLRIRMYRIAIAGQAIQQRQIRTGWIVDRSTR